MSRTYKHIKRVKLKKFYKERWDTLHDKISYERESYYDPGIIYNAFLYLKKAGALPKLRKELDTEDHWMSTPSWWTRLCMTKPQRREGRLWECEVVKISPTDLEEVDKPSVSRKPHIYYW